MLINTLSHKWGKLNLPILLFKVGSLTPIINPTLFTPLQVLSMLSQSVFPHIRSCFQLSLWPDEVHSSGWKLVFKSTPVLFQRKSTCYNYSNRMRNLHKYILENNGIEVLRLLSDWERLHYRDCNYKNHRIFTLRCLHNDLVPVSIKLKSTFKNWQGKEILRLAEKQLLQARIKSINSLLDNNAQQIKSTRSKIVSILLNPSYNKCQEFIEKSRG